MFWKPTTKKEQEINKNQPRRKIAKNQIEKKIDPMSNQTKDPKLIEVGKQHLKIG